MKNKLLLLATTSLMLGTAAHAGPATITNGSFETSTAGAGSAALYDTILGSWFMENHLGSGTAVDVYEVAQRRNAANMPVVPDGNQWANLTGVTDVTAGIYQAIGTYSDNWDYTFTGFTVSQRSNQPFVGVTVGLYAGTVTGANNTNLATLGATLLDSFTITQSVFSASGVAESYVAPSFTLESGTAGTAGETLWLRISSTGVGHHLVDKVSVSAIPEPGSLTLLGLAGLGVWIGLRRRKR